MNNNKLIAEFMGLPTEVFKSGKINYYFREFNSGTWYEEHELSYNVSWDWLMPVVESCFERLDARDTSADQIKKQLATCHIDYVYQAVVEFIKQYNQNK